MKVEVMALEPCNNHKPGDRWMESAWHAEELVKKRLVKMVSAHPNKMRAPPENKANPIQAAGTVRTSSASPAAPVSPSATVQPRRRGRPPNPKPAK